MFEIFFEASALSFKITHDVFFHVTKLFFNKGSWSFSLRRIHEFSKKFVFVALVGLRRSMRGEVFANIFAKCGEIVESASFLGEFVVDSWLSALVDLLDKNFKYYWLASEIFNVIILREGNFKIFFVARGKTNNAFFEAWNKLTRAKYKLEIFGGTTIKCDAVFFADEINDNFITHLGSTLNNLGLSEAFGNAFYDVIDIFIRNLWLIIGCDNFLVIAKFYVWHNVGLDGNLRHLAWNVFRDLNMRNRDWHHISAVK